MGGRDPTGKGGKRKSLETRLGGKKMLSKRVGAFLKRKKKGRKQKLTLSEVWDLQKGGPNSMKDRRRRLRTSSRKTSKGATPPPHISKEEKNDVSPGGQRPKKQIRKAEIPEKEKSPEVIPNRAVLPCARPSRAGPGGRERGVRAWPEAEISQGSPEEALKSLSETERRKRTLERGARKTLNQGRRGSRRERSRKEKALPVYLLAFRNRAALVPEKKGINYGFLG